uniref:Cartilage intermediate layer protein 1-like n=1 Tax=Saccoglossus kowalevskii TaxID=10224 RepID=A0ABM0MQV6_SACKO|nr:PREDICTED: cartilage intermediate layer protein 1-like [Saccoglossus kowalevskii]
MSELNGSYDEPQAWQDGRTEKDVQERTTLAIGITSLVLLGAVAGVGFLAYRTVQEQNTAPDSDSSTQSPNLRTAQLTAIPSTTAIVHASTMKPPTYIRGGTSWLTWEQWTNCDVTCGVGVQIRTRSCYTTLSTKICTGNPQQARTCADWECPSCLNRCIEGIYRDDCVVCVCENDVVIATVNDIAGRPVHNVRISRSEQPHATVATTDENGQFRIDGVCIYSSVLIVEKEQFLTKRVNTSTSSVETNLGGRIASLNIKIDRIEPLRITDHPEDQVSYTGQNVSYYCLAQSNPQPTYYEWFKDGIIIDEVVYGHNNLLYLYNVSKSDEALYTCRANSEVGSMYSLGASLTVIESDEEICNPTPKQELIELPEECRDVSSEKRYYNIEPLRITDHPEDQVSYIGQNVSYSCLAQSNPQPSYYEWFKDGIIIDEVVYGHNNLLFLYNVSKSDEAMYTCRANSEVGSMYSLGASLTVIESDEEICNPTPEQGLIELPEECRDVSSEKRYYDIGKCSNKLCPGCQDTICSVSQDNCCIPLLYSTHNISCDTFDMVVSVITRCSCGPCLKQQVKVEVELYPLLIDHLSELRNFSVKKLKLRKQTAKHFRYVPPSITLNASETSSIPLGGSEVTPSMELDIPAGAFHSEDGSVYEGNVKGSITFTDPIADDENDNPLRVDGDMELFIDAEKANIDPSSDDLPHLWFLNQESGEWENIGDLRVSSENRKKRNLESRTFLVGNINVLAYDLTDLPACNIDQFVNTRNVCYLKVRVYEGETMLHPLSGVELTAITNEQIVFDRYAPDFGRGRFSFFNRATTGVDGSACVRTFCARNDSFYVINVSTKYVGTYLTVHDPRSVSAASHSGTWPQDLLNTVELSDGSTEPSIFITMKGLTPQMADSKSYYGGWWYYDYKYEYELYDYEQYENREFGPFYWHWWDYYLAKDACMMANNTENHVVFTGKGRHGDAFAYNTEPYDIWNSNDDYEKLRTELSWYPYEGELKRSCFIKILVDSDRSERFRVSSFGGGSTAAGDAMYGIRIDYSKPNPPNSEISNKTAACIEFKCSGFIRTGDPYEEDGVLGDDQTVMEIAPTSTSYKRCILKYPDQVNTHFFDFVISSDVQDEYRRVRVKIPSNTLYPDIKTGLYASSGSGNTSYVNVMENCYAGDERASLINGYPDRPGQNYALEYECTTNT